MSAIRMLNRKKMHATKLSVNTYCTMYYPHELTSSVNQRDSCQDKNFVEKLVMFVLL